MSFFFLYVAGLIGCGCVCLWPAADWVFTEIQEAGASFLHEDIALIKSSKKRNHFVFGGIGDVWESPASKLVLLNRPLKVKQCCVHLTL